MADLTVVAGGVCSTCVHSQKTHEDNNGGTECDCTAIGSY